MNLDEFIRESLLEVLRGIKEAQKTTNEQGGRCWSYSSKIGAREGSPTNTC